MIPFKEATKPYEHLLLDPNNYRFQEATDFRAADPKRFAEQTVQNKAYERLKGEALVQLKNSILRNGFLPFERLVVTPYGKDRFLVLEGNRRLAALRWIAEDHAAGSEVSEAVLSSLTSVPVVVFEQTAEDPALKEALMGIRHVSGIKEWGGYQRALLVASLKDNHHLESNEISQRLGMSANEVNRRYRAYKALAQMMADEEYGEHARPDMYPLFHEAISLPMVKTWLGWDETTATFTQDESRKQFYDLISIPLELSGSDTKRPKIESYAQVRELKAILDNPEARQVLFDPTRTFVEASAVSKSKEIAGSWRTEIAEATSALENISVAELKKFGDDEIMTLTKLRDISDSLLSDAAALGKNKK